MINDHPEARPACGPYASGPTVPAHRVVRLDVVVPVYNEEVDLAPSVRRLDDYLARELPHPYLITIADNASTDTTWQIAQALVAERQHVRALHLDAKGRGLALRSAWLASEAEVCAYVDVDLSTDLKALPPLVAPLLSGHSDLAIGTRLVRSAAIVRGPKRDVLSRGYNLLLRVGLGARFSDAQCGFKAIRADVAGELLPLVADPAWFFDTELLVLAQRAGLRIHEVPVDWVDDPDSRVDILPTVTADLRGIGRLAAGLGRIDLSRVAAIAGRSRPTPRRSARLVRFGVVGLLSTLAYLLLFAVLRTVLDAQAANLIALIITAVGNTALNRRFTFGVLGSRRLLSDHLGGLVVFAVGLMITSGSLWWLSDIAERTGRRAELATLVVANLAATAIRFGLLTALLGGRRRTLSG